MQDVTLGPSGSTLFSPAEQAVFCEIHMRQVVQDGVQRGNATPDAEWVLANRILHGLGHALLDAKPPIVTEVHKLKGGTILRDTDTKPVTERDRPSGADNSAFQTGFGRPKAGAKPYAGAMPG